MDISVDKRNFKWFHRSFLHFKNVLGYCDFPQITRNYERFTESFCRCAL